MGVTHVQTTTSGQEPTSKNDSEHPTIQELRDFGLHIGVYLG